MRVPRPAVRALLCVAVVSVASWGLGEEGGRAAGGVRPLGVVGAGGDTQAGLLTIHGHHLLPAEGELQVRLAGQVLEVVSATSVEIQALLPAGLGPGTYLLEVLAGPVASWAAPVDVGEVADGAPPEPVQVSLLRVRAARADLIAGTLIVRGESLGTSPDTTPTVTLSDVPLVVLSANEVSVEAQLPIPLEPGTYRLRVVRTAPGGTASVWTDAIDVTTVAGDGMGDIMAVETPAGGGLQGGVTSGEAALRLVGCGVGQVLKSDGAAWSCAADADTGVNSVVGGGGVIGWLEPETRTLMLGSTATATNTAGAIVARNETGGFGAGSIWLAGNLGLPDTTSASAGVLTKGGLPFLHNFGTDNTFVGANAGNTTLTGTSNSAFGYSALRAGTTGDWNSAFGYNALRANTTGYMNSAFGMGALGANTTGMSNSAFGNSALTSNPTGDSNTAFGAGALWQFSSGYGNTAVGSGAGGALWSGSENIYIGNYVTGAGDESNTIRIGTTQTATYIGGIYGQTSASGLAVYVASDGKLGTGGSSGSGDITAVNTPAGGGLQGGVTSGDANLGLQTCGSGQVLKSGGATWACAADADTDTGVNAVVGGGGVTGSITGRTLTLGSTATPNFTASAIVARDGAGSFLAGSIGLAGNLDLPNTTSAAVGVLTKSGTRFLHNSGTYNTFVGAAAGNFTLTGTGNAAFGTNALSSNTTGNTNAAFGLNALLANTTGYNNSAFGPGVLELNVSGNRNSAFGYLALAANTTGLQNAAFGTNALVSSTTASNNSAFGAYALNANTTGTSNAAFGTNALSSNTTASDNSAFGFLALYANTTGISESAFGAHALQANTGNSNSAFGAYALNANTTGFLNAAFGAGALKLNTTAYGNSAFGGGALQANTTASFNSAFGMVALGNNTTGSSNSAFGAYALASNTEGASNAAVGYQALFANTTGYENVAVGYQALTAHVTGSNNVAVGNGALGALTSGNGNIAIGTGAASDLTSGSNNIFIGSTPGVLSGSNGIHIGNNTYVSTRIYGIYGRPTAGLPVYVDSHGYLGTDNASSARYKDEIVDMGAESDVLLKLRPVSFYYRPEHDWTHSRQYGLVAEEVAEVAPGLVDYDEDGQPQTVRYHLLNAMLLNEVQKQRQQLEAQDEQLRAQGDQLRTQADHLETQDRQLQAQDAVIRGLEDHLARLEARLQ